MSRALLKLEKRRKVWENYLTVTSRKLTGKVMPNLKAEFLNRISEFWWRLRVRPIDSMFN